MPFIAVVVLVILALLAIIIASIEFIVLWIVRWYAGKPKSLAQVADEMPTEFDEDED